MARGPWLLRARRSQRLARRRKTHRARRRPSREPARWSAVRGPHARLRIHLRGNDAIAPRRGSAPSRRRAHRSRDVGRRHTVGRAALAARRRVMASASEPLAREQHGAVLIARLDRPEARNALTPELLHAIGAALLDAENDPDLRAL